MGYGPGANASSMGGEGRGEIAASGRCAAAQVSPPLLGPEPVPGGKTCLQSFGGL